MPTTTANDIEERTVPLTIECQEHYQEVLTFAMAHHCLEELNAKLERLSAMTRWPERCYLHKDFAPLSFAFMICDGDNNRRLIGGLIYSGPNQTLDGSAPTYTVSVEPPSNEHKWSIHT